MKKRGKENIPEFNPAEKLIRLKEIFLGLKKVAVAYSGGVDSAFLLRVAYDALSGNAIGIYVDSSLQPENEKKEALKTARKIGARIVILEADPLSLNEFSSNPRNRCYYCKGFLFRQIQETARHHGFFIVIDGSNFDDLADFRPGKKALLEMNVRSPLQEAGLTKQEIRYLSKTMDLPTWEKDSYACLASRIPYGSPINISKLKQIENVELLLSSHEFRNIRARHMGQVVRLEVRADQVKRLTELIENETFRKSVLNTGFTKIEIDEHGYRQGSLNL